MKIERIIPIVVLVPLIVVTILALMGVTLSFWAYLLLAATCLLVAGVVFWFLYKDAVKQVADAEKGGGKESR